MARNNKNGKDSKKENNTDAEIRKLLKSGSLLWVREIARLAGMDKSTVSRHLIAMGRELEWKMLGRNKMCRLKKKRKTP